MCLVGDQRVYTAKDSRYGNPLEKFITFGPDTSKTKGKPRCYQSLYADYNRHQCYNAATVFDECGNQWCGNHSAAANQRRLDKRNATSAKWQRQSELNKRRWGAEKALLQALRDIEAGHNDPRALAREVLAEYDDAHSPEAKIEAETGVRPDGPTQ